MEDCLPMQWVYTNLFNNMSLLQSQPALVLAYIRLSKSVRGSQVPLGDRPKLVPG